MKAFTLPEPTAKNTLLSFIIVYLDGACVLFMVVFFSCMSKYAEILQHFASRAEEPSANHRLLILPVESVRDDAVVHELPPPPELDRDVQLQNESNALSK